MRSVKQPSRDRRQATSGNLARPRKTPSSPLGRLIRLSLIPMIFGLWEGGVFIFDPPSFVLPSPSAVLITLFNQHSLLIQGLGYTAAAAAIGLLLGAALGFLFATMLFFWRDIESITLPLLIGFDSIPKLALAPVILVWVGIGISSRIVNSALLCFFPFVILLLSGYHALSVDSARYLQSLRVSRLRIFLHIRLPLAVPYALDATRLAIPLSIVGAVVGEFVSSENGLGYITLTAIGRLDMSLAFASLSIMAAMSVTAFLSLQVLEKTVLKRFSHENR